MKVLVIAPHPDDETLGCGGAICKHRARGDLVSVVFLTSGELGLKQLPRDEAQAVREREAARAGRILGCEKLHFLRCSDWMLGDEQQKVSDLLRPILREQQPELIYLPHPEDNHPDHRVTLPILRAAFESGKHPFLRGYEMWSPMAKYDVFEDISSVMSRKLRALRAHKSQLQEFDYCRAVSGLNQYRGIVGGKCKYAEVFCELPSNSHQTV